MNFHPDYQLFQVAEIESQVQCSPPTPQGTPLKSYLLHGRNTLDVIFSKLPETNNELDVDLT